MMTEDAIRRRELASAGIKAEVEGDGFRIVVTLDQPAFDEMVSVINESARSEADRAANNADYHEGFEDGTTQGWDNAVEAMREVVRQADEAKAA